jgi:hypothetical protein
MPARILLQLDTDPQPSTFDAVVAVDAGADVLLRHGGVSVESVVPLVHGAMFTRGGADLAATAIFIGGSDVPAAEAVFAKVQKTFFGSVRVGVLLDPSGANTTAAAAVVAASRHLRLDQSTAGIEAVVLGGTGPVGQRVTRLLAGLGVAVTLVSRSLERAREVCERVRSHVPGATLRPVEARGASAEEPELAAALATAQLVVACGAAGVTLLDERGVSAASAARVLVDLNAVPPAGIAGIAATDKDRADHGRVLYGALGVGGTKMKIHKEAIRRLFAANDTVLDAEQLLAIGMELERAKGA